MTRDISFRLIAERNNNMHKRMVELANKDIQYIGMVCFFREQSIEMLLRHLLVMRDSKPSTIHDVVDLAKMVQTAYPQFVNEPALVACATNVGVTLISWDIDGRYTPNFKPSIEDLELTRTIYEGLHKLATRAEQLADDPMRSNSVYTTRFAEWSERS